MKYLVKAANVFTAFLLPIAIAFSGFSGNAHAQSENVNVEIDANKTIDQILGIVSSKQKFQVVIVNQTGYTLTRVGAHNYSENWILGDVPSLTAQYRDWSPRNASTSFSFAANYAVGDTGRFFQFAAAWPPIGRRKINLCARNASDNDPAKVCWEAMTDADDKSATNDQFSAKALMGNNNGRVQWIYQVK